MRRGIVLRGCAVVALATTSAVAAGCDTAGRPAVSTSMQAQMAGASAAAGSVSISGAYIPRPASPDVAALYFTVRNNGAADVTLTGVRTSAAASAGFHQYVNVSGGGQEMAPLGSITVPAGGDVRLAPDGLHVMLEAPQALAVGQIVPVTIEIEHQQAITVDVPVVPMTGLQTMDDMPGMDMGG